MSYNKKRQDSDSDALPIDGGDYEDMPSLEDEKIALRNWKLDEEIKKRKLQEEMRRKKLEEEEMIRKRDEYYAENYTPEELKINPADYGFEVDFVDKNSESDEGMLPLEGDFDNDEEDTRIAGRNWSSSSNKKMRLDDGDDSLPTDGHMKILQERIRENAERGLPAGIQRCDPTQLVVYENRTNEENLSDDDSVFSRPQNLVPDNLKRDSRLFNKYAPKASDLIQFNDLPPQIELRKKLNHLAPRSVVDGDNSWPLTLIDPDTVINRNFRGTGPTDKDNVFDEHYQTNKNNQFVWTNQNVVKGDVKFDPDIINDAYKASADFLRGEYGEVCNLQNPDESFYLKKVEKLGHGLFARHFINKGSIIGEYTGELIDNEEFKKRFLKYKKEGLTIYIYDTCMEISVDGGPMGNHTRFINHSCDNNCNVTHMQLKEDGLPKVVISATKDIQEDEQVFLNYGDGYFCDLRCICGYEDCLEKRRNSKGIIEKKPGVDSSDEETSDSDDSASVSSENSALEVGLRMDLKHLAPRSVVDANAWSEILIDPDTVVNRNFQGTGPTDKDDVFDEHYKFNKDKQFVWTNQNVIKRGGEYDIRDLSPGTKIADADLMFRIVEGCQNPDESFYLKKVENLGLGLFARHLIKEGSYIGEYTGELITQTENAKRSLKYHAQGLTKYIFSTSNTMSIDAGPMGNHTRFINHSCNDNCEAEHFKLDDGLGIGLPKVMIKATRDIQEGEQVFLNYGDQYFKHLKCMCGYENCLETRRNADPLHESWHASHDETEEELLPSYSPKFIEVKGRKVRKRRYSDEL